MYIKRAKLYMVKNLAKAICNSERERERIIHRFFFSFVIIIIIVIRFKQTLIEVRHYVVERNGFFLYLVYFY